MVLSFKFTQVTDLIVFYVLVTVIPKVCVLKGNVHATTVSQEFIAKKVSFSKYFRNFSFEFLQQFARFFARGTDCFCKECVTVIMGGRESNVISRQTFAKAQIVMDAGVAPAMECVCVTLVILERIVMMVIV